eukprot:scaffold6286_cov106-Isochrysis_galbana.AAC.6
MGKPPHAPMCAHHAASTHISYRAVQLISLHCPRTLPPTASAMCPGDLRLRVPCIPARRLCKRAGWRRAPMC